MKRLALASALVVVAAGCTSFSSYQTARLLAPGHYSATGALAVGWHQNASGATDTTVIVPEAMLRRGVTPDLEVGAKVSHAERIDRTGGRLTLGFVDAAYSLIPDELAVDLSVGAGYTDSDFNSYQAQPTLMWTRALGRTYELDVATKTIFVLDQETHGRLSINFAVDAGVRFRSDFHRLELQPEVGLMLGDVTKDGTSLGDNLVIALGFAVIFAP